MDVDRFKNVNDTLGHAIGDQLLLQVSERLVSSVRASDTVGRLGGDEFGVVLSNLSDPQDAAAVAKKIIGNFDQPFHLEGSEIYVTPSIGITLYPKDGTEQDDLIKNADAAMYRAKESGRNNYQYYSPEMSARGRALLNLEGSLRRALENEEFLLYYQPKATVASGKISGFEALLRWQRPEVGLVSPVEFIPVLEETGLIVQAGEWVLNAVCIQINEWIGAGIKPVPVAVNLSARQFLAPDLGPTIKRIIETHRIDPGLIELEITESSLMANAQEAERTLEYLRSLGVALSIDDFGTGYSSLSYLKRFPLHALKVDRSFVRDITTDANDAAITLAVISMAHSLGLKVVAEGVETKEQLSFLAQHGATRFRLLSGETSAAAECTRTLVEDRRLQYPALVSNA
jgi:diguanylate cyclase (GGDEF)-like protein